MTLKGATLVAAVLVPLAAGCGGGGGDGTTSTPAGFRETKAADFSLALPSAWKVDTLVSDSRGETIEARPPGTDVNRAQLRVASARHYKSDLNGAVKLTEGEIPVRRPGATRVASKPIDVPGATDARRIEWTVPGGGGLEPARIVTVLALSKDRTLVNLSVGVAQSQAAETRIEDVVRSLRVGS